MKTSFSLFILSSVAVSGLQQINQEDAVAAPFPTIIGTAMKCKDDTDTSKVYRYDGGTTIRWYPNREIAASWDPTWESAVVEYSCEGATHGEDMDQLVIGHAVRCIGDDTKVYRYYNDKLRWYPNPDIASAWDSKWSSNAYINCDGKEMLTEMALPAAEFPSVIGTAMSCLDDTDRAKKYRYTGGTTIQWYPNSEIATSWDANWQSAQSYDCTHATRGADMALFSTTPTGTNCRRRFRV